MQFKRTVFNPQNTGSYYMLQSPLPVYGFQWGKKIEIPTSCLVFGQRNNNHYTCSSHSGNAGSPGFVWRSNSSKSPPQLLYWTKQIVPYTFNTQGLRVPLPHFPVLQNHRPFWTGSTAKRKAELWQIRGSV